MQKVDIITALLNDNTIGFDSMETGPNIKGVKLWFGDLYVSVKISSKYMSILEFKKKLALQLKSVAS